jgi:hypothetical protein
MLYIKLYDSKIIQYVLQHLTTGQLSLIFAVSSSSESAAEAALLLED